VVKCSFKSNYTNFDLQKEIEVECEYEKQPQSDKCIFHDKHFLDNKVNRKIIQEEFQNKLMNIFQRWIIIHYFVSDTTSLI
jgi:hypothetical protein